MKILEFLEILDCLESLETLENQETSEKEKRLLRLRLRLTLTLTLNFTDLYKKRGACSYSALKKTKTKIGEIGFTITSRKYFVVFT